MAFRSPSWLSIDSLPTALPSGAVCVSVMTLPSAAATKSAAALKLTFLLSGISCADTHPEAATRRSALAIFDFFIFTFVSLNGHHIILYIV